MISTAVNNVISSIFCPRLMYFTGTCNSQGIFTEDFDFSCIVQTLPLTTPDQETRKSCKVFHLDWKQKKWSETFLTVYCPLSRCSKSGTFYIEINFDNQNNNFWFVGCISLGFSFVRKVRHVYFRLPAMICLSPISRWTEVCWNVLICWDVMACVVWHLS